MSVTTCTVSGTILTTSGSGFAGVTIRAYMTQPSLYSDGSLVPSYSVSTTTDANGAWSLTVVETTTTSQYMTFAFEYPDGGINLKRKEYTAVIPATATSTFYALSPVGVGL